MKKIIITLLAVLLILSFTSCDKSEEMISTYEKFVKAYNLGDRIYSLKSSAGEIATANYKDTNKEDVEIILEYLFDYDAAEFDIEEITEAKGSVTATEGYESGTHLTYKNFEFSYTYKNGEESGSDKLTLSGTYSYDEKDEVETYIYDFTINNEAFKAEYSLKNSEEFTYAKINGESVKLSLLNARLSIR